MKKLTFLIILILSILSVSAQETVKLTVSGQGTTKEEATANALRSAIEQSFGVFVSANTQILNDEVVKDEIATISSGNIKEYKELGCITMPNGQQFVTLSATVSINNLISYARSKGSTVEFAGATFAMNMKIRKINKENESKALLNLTHQLESTVKNGGLFDISIETDGQPYKIKCYNPSTKSKKDFYGMYFTLNYFSTEHTKQLANTLFSTLESLSLSLDEIASFIQANEDFYQLSFIDNMKYIKGGTSSDFYITNDAKIFYLRNNPTDFIRNVVSAIDKSLYTSFVFQIHGLEQSFLISEKLELNDSRCYNENCIVDERDHDEARIFHKFHKDDHWRRLIFSQQNHISIQNQIVTYARLPHNTEVKMDIMVVDKYGKTSLSSERLSKNKHIRDYHKSQEYASVICIDNLFSWRQISKMIYQIKFDFPFTENQLGECSSFSIEPIIPADEVEKDIPTINDGDSQNSIKCRDVHRVEKGETIFSICRQYGITEEELIVANPEIKKYGLGKFLCIPYPSRVNNK